MKPESLDINDVINDVAAVTAALAMTLDEASEDHDPSVVITGLNMVVAGYISIVADDKVALANLFHAELLKILSQET